jgi:hypothetical protein
LYIDELTNSEGKGLSDMAYQFTGGKQKGRMSGGSNRERVRGKPWSLLSVSTGNTSVLEQISGSYKTDPQAEAQRIMELHVSPIDTIEKADTDAFNRLLAGNYGHAMPIYLKAIMADLPAVQELLMKVQKRIDSYCVLGKENRFWSAKLTCVIVGAVIAKKLGLLPYDTHAMFLYTKEIVDANKKSLMGRSVSAEASIGVFLAEHHGSILRVNSNEDRRRVHGNGLDELAVVKAERDPNVKLVARYEPDTKKLYIVKSVLTTWCIKQQINAGEFIKELSDCKNFRAIEKRVRLTKGLNMPSVATAAIILDCANTEIGDEIDSD